MNFYNSLTTDSSCINLTQRKHVVNITYMALSKRAPSQNAVLRNVVIVYYTYKVYGIRIHELTQIGDYI